MNKKTIILASSSRYRAELLSRLGLSFEVIRPDLDEAPLPGELPARTAERLAIAKAQAISEKRSDRCLVIGSDQVADLDGSHIGKPGTRDRARLQLAQMRGKTLVFQTGLALIDSSTGQIQSIVVPTTVRFRAYSDAEIEHYLERENALDCAGSAKSEGLGVALIASMQSDDPTALVGLPLIALVDMFEQAGMKVLA